MDSSNMLCTRGEPKVIVPESAPAILVSSKGEPIQSFLAIKFAGNGYYVLLTGNVQCTDGDKRRVVWSDTVGILCPFTTGIRICFKIIDGDTTCQGYMWIDSTRKIRLLSIN